ncbi:MAG: hypothetical protein JNL63_10965 [Bacteroidia bacterium]|nr:hypothetical protein [Bacteroidia bacterium]
MKKSTSTLFTLAIATVIFMSCGGNKTKEMLARKWQISEFKVDGMDEQMAQMRAAADTTKDSTMKVQYVQQVKMVESYMEEMKKSTLDYKNDGTFEASMSVMGQTQNVKGTWTLSEDGKQVVIVDDKQKADTMNVDEISADKFVSSGVSGGKKSTFILVPAQ